MDRYRNLVEQIALYSKKPVNDPAPMPEGDLRGAHRPIPMETWINEERKSAFVAEGS